MRQIAEHEPDGPVPLHDRSGARRGVRAGEAQIQKTKIGTGHPKARSGQETQEEGQAEKVSGLDAASEPLQRSILLVRAAARICPRRLPRYYMMLLTKGDLVAVRIRMKRLGRKHRSYFRIVAIDSRQRAALVIEELGSYDPMVKNTDDRVRLKPDRIKYWMSVGALPSEKCTVLFNKYMKKFEELEAQQAQRAPAAPAETPAARRVRRPDPVPGDLPGLPRPEPAQLAIQNGLVEIHLWNIRDWAKGKHHSVDDRPYGGGPGMVIMPEPVFDYVDVQQQAPEPGLLLMMTPAGQRLTQQVVQELATHRRLLLCAAGMKFDERVRLGLTPREDVGQRLFVTAARCPPWS